MRNIQALVLVALTAILREVTSEVICRESEAVSGAGCSVNLTPGTVTKDTACSELQGYDFMPVSNDDKHWKYLFVTFIYPTSTSGVCQEIWMDAEYDETTRQILVGGLTVDPKFYELAADFDVTTCHRCLTAERLNTSAILIRHRGCDELHPAACVTAQDEGECSHCNVDEICVNAYNGFSCSHQCVPSNVTTDEPSGSHEGTPVNGGGCSYVPFESIKTKSRIEDCCPGPLTSLAPVSGDQLMDYGYVLGSTMSEKTHITSLMMRLSQVYIDDEIVDVADMWKNGVQPTGNISCIAAESTTPGRYVIYPVNCTEELPFICVTATGPCNCSEDEKCVATFDNLCHTECRTRQTTDSPTTSAPPDPIPTTGYPDSPTMSPPVTLQDPTTTDSPDSQTTSPVTLADQTKTTDSPDSQTTTPASTATTTVVDPPPWVIALIIICIFIFIIICIVACVIITRKGACCKNVTTV